MGAFKTGALLGFGIGYMRGSKAGRPRYDRINQQIKKLDLPNKMEPVKTQGKAALTSAMEKAAGVKSKVSIGSGKSSSSSNNGSTA